MLVKMCWCWCWCAGCWLELLAAPGRVLVLVLVLVLASVELGSSDTRHYVGRAAKVAASHRVLLAGCKLGLAGASTQNNPYSRR